MFQVALIVGGIVAVSFLYIFTMWSYGNRKAHEHRRNRSRSYRRS